MHKQQADLKLLASGEQHISRHFKYSFINHDGSRYSCFNNEAFWKLQHQFDVCIQTGGQLTSTSLTERASEQASAVPKQKVKSVLKQEGGLFVSAYHLGFVNGDPELRKNGGVAPVLCK